MQVLELERVTKHFKGLAAVVNVDFHVDKCEIVGLIGPNGAGKTTIFNLISGSLVPTSGLIKFNDENITGLKPHQICKKGIARTFQLVKLFTDMTVLENVLLALLFGTSRSISTSNAEKEAEELLRFTGLSTMKSNLAKDLTIANQKRLEIARALATKPKLLLLDEVIAGLNVVEVASVMQLIAQVRDQGTTVLMIEHVMRAIMSLCDRIIVLHHGEKIAEGTPQEIATSRTVIEVYLGNRADAEG